MCGARPDDGKHAGIRILLKMHVAFRELRILHVFGRFHRKEALKIIDQSEIHGAIVHRDQITVSAGLHLAGFECNGLQILDRISLGAVLGVEFLHRSVRCKLARLLDNLLICKKVRIGCIFVSVQRAVFARQERRIIYVIHVSVFLILNILVDRTVVRALLVPYVVRLEDNASFDAGIHQKHDQHDDDKEREDRKQNAFEHVFLHIFTL